MSARCSRSLAMATAWEPASPAESRSEGLWATANWMSPVLRDRRRSRVEALDGLDAEPQLLPGLVADHDPQVARVGELAHPAAPGVEASSAMPTASSPSGSSRDRLRDWMGARQSTSMVVWSSNRPARAPETSWPRASRSSRVSSRKCRADCVPACRRSARRWGCRAGATAAGWWPPASGCAPCGVAGQVLQGGLDHDLVGGPERHPLVAEALAADQAADQGEPAAEDDRGPALRLGRGRAGPSRGRGARRRAG